MCLGYIDSLRVWGRVSPLSLSFSLCYVVEHRRQLPFETVSTETDKQLYALSVFLPRLYCTSSSWLNDSPFYIYCTWLAGNYAISAATVNAALRRGVRPVLSFCVFYTPLPLVCFQFRLLFSLPRRQMLRLFRAATQSIDSKATERDQSTLHAQFNPEFNRLISNHAVSRETDSKEIILKKRASHRFFYCLNWLKVFLPKKVNRQIWTKRGTNKGNRSDLLFFSFSFFFPAIQPFGRRLNTFSVLAIRFLLTTFSFLFWLLFPLTGVTS